MTDEVEPGDIIGIVQETDVIEHRIMVPPHFPPGKIKEIEKGSYTVEDVIGKLDTDKGEFVLKMMHRWPVRKQRPIKEQLSPTLPLVTGQRVVDAFLPGRCTGCAASPFFLNHILGQ